MSWNGKFWDFWTNSDEDISNNGLCNSWFYSPFWQRKYLKWKDLKYWTNSDQGLYLNATKIVSLQQFALLALLATAASADRRPQQSYQQPEQRYQQPSRPSYHSEEKQVNLLLENNLYYHLTSYNNENKSHVMQINKLYS